MQKKWKVNFPVQLPMLLICRVGIWRGRGERAWAMTPSGPPGSSAYQGCRKVVKSGGGATFRITFY